MKHASEKLLRLEARGIDLFLDAGVLKARGRKGALDDEIVFRIKNNKKTLSDYLRSNFTTAEARRALLAPVARDSNRLPSSFAQQRLWFLDRLDGGSAHYNMPLALRVTGGFDVSVAEQAFCRIIERHEPLRTVFGSDGNEVWQEIRDSVDFRIALVNIAHLGAAEMKERAQELARIDAGRPFDLATDVMLRASYIRFDERCGMLLFNVHHIACEGWSAGILVEEFLAQYEAIRSGGENPLPPLAIQYADYAQWQRNWLAGEVLERQIHYWEQQLRDLPPVHALPLSRPRAARPSFTGARYQFTIDDSVSRALKLLAQERHATLFMVLHAALSILLARHSNSTDIAVGTPVANRTQKELEKLIGFFVNTLVLRVNCSGNPHFIEFLERIKTVHLDAQSNQDVPFEYIVERLQPQRSTQHSPLFQIAFGLGIGVEARDDSVEIEGVRFSAEIPPEVGAKYELQFEAREIQGGLAFLIEYDTELFEAVAITRLAEHFSILLSAIAADPRTPIHALPLLSAEERHHLLYTLNATQASYPKEKCIHELFEEQVRKTPDGIAVVCEAQSLTYTQLNERANRLARYLREEIEISPDALVGVSMEPSLDMIVTLIGILKTGGGYVPLDPAYPQARQVYLLADAALQTVVMRKSLSDRMPISEAQYVFIDDAMVDERVNAHLATNIDPEEIGLRSHHVAYVLYTSGSTGDPKGVVIEHASVVNIALATQRRYELVSEDGLLLFSSINFDPSVANIFSVLCSGCRLILRSEDWLLPTQQFWERCASFNVTILDLPTAYWHELARDPQLVPARSVRAISFGGDKVDPARVTEWYRKASTNIRLFNVYGPTETTVDTTMAQLSDSVSHIGKPIDNVFLYVLNGGVLALYGTPCELHIGGAGLAREYLHLPELTAERFISNPYYVATDSFSSRRLYKTGDFVRYLQEGSLEYIGRLDDQVKIRGYRVELGEIEKHLTQNEHVGSAVMVARGDIEGEKKLVAYVTARHENYNGPELIASVCSRLDSKLPQYMVPPLFVVLDKMPLTPNGKLDKNALPAPDSSPRTGHVAPTTQSERALVVIWAELLFMDPNEIRTTANFFELGGHSLLLIRLNSRIADEFNIQMSAAKLFELTDIVRIAEVIDGAELNLISQRFQSMPIAGATEWRS